MNAPTDARILLVDDVMENIQTVSAILRPKGYRLNIARSGKFAIEVARKTIPDLILLDLMMPEMDGFECCRILKSDPLTRDIPVIFLTASSQKEDIDKGLKIGAVDYVFKPFRATQLLSRIDSNLAIRSLRKSTQPKFPSGPLGDA